MLVIRDLRFNWNQGPFSLSIPSLTLETGSLAAITGPSGCGKTTLLNLIAGILRPVSGTIQADEIHLSELNDIRRRRFRLRHIGMVFQDFQLIEYLNVLDNVLLAARLSSGGPLTRQHRDRACALLESVGLLAHRVQSVTRLSQGERQRVAICRALLLQPSVILADEPTGNLDPHTASQVLNLLLEQVRAAHATLVMVTHDHSLLSRFDRHVPFDQFLSAVPRAPSDHPADDGKARPFAGKEQP